ncbi:hypothetical protein BH10CHL1_BH10CHL1_11840 [soil metagenome]
MLETIPDLLLACLCATPPEYLAARLSQISPTSWDQLVALATTQQVGPLLYHRLKAQGYAPAIPAVAWQNLQKIYYANAARNMRIYQELSKLTEALHAQTIPVLVLKGAHLAASVYETLALRTMLDIDLLVHQTDLLAVIEQIQTLGYQPITPMPSLDALLAHRHHLPPFVHPQAVAAIEIHWTITLPNQSYTIPMDELWARSTPVTLHNIATRGLCPEDLLLHICMHATYHHWLQQGVRFLADIAEIVHVYGEQLDWESVIARASAWKWQKGTFLALAAAQQLLGAKLPQQVLEQADLVMPIKFALGDLQPLLFPAHPDLLNSPSGYFLNFLNNPSLLAKIRLFAQRLFLSPEEMSVKYGLAPQSAGRYLYYPARLSHLLSSFAHQAWQMWLGEPVLKDVASKQARLQRWLEHA